MRRGAGRLAVALAIVVGIAGSSAAMDVRRLELDEVVARADCIVHGTVASIVSGRDGDGIPATWVTLDVEECLKGGTGPSLTVKQVGVQDPMPDGTLFRIPGLPRYRPGDEVVLFLHAPSGRGFTSPVGMAQGYYRVEASERGRVVRAAREPAAAAPSAAAEMLPAFLDRVRQRVGR